MAGCSCSERERYRAAMLLSGAGDAIGYKNQEWEYCTSGPTIHEELKELGGLATLTAELPAWPVSDDTVMHLALADAITSEKVGLPVKREDMLLEIARQFKDCMSDMEGRKPGPTSIKGTDLLDPTKPGGYRIPFNPTGTGCGAAMRSMCLGLRYPSPEQEEELVAYSIEAGRMTHHHPTGYLGSLASAVFTAFAIRGKPMESWGRGLLDILPLAKAYIESANVSVEENKQAWAYFPEKWTWYLQQRGILDGVSKPIFPVEYGVSQRDEIYKSFSLDGWAGRSGHDAPMIAYDALLAARNDWFEFANRAFFHAGDSDSTAVIGAAWWGALYGFEGVPSCNYNKLEYRERLLDNADKIFALKNAS